jgi:DNA-3-methyladenine glycosylase II
MTTAVSDIPPAYLPARRIHVYATLDAGSDSQRYIVNDAFELTQARIRADLDVVAEHDPRVAKAIDRCGYPAERRAGSPSFGHLLRILTGQQLSVKAAATIYARLEGVLGDPPTPEGLLSLSERELRAIGLSRQKIAYSQELARTVVDGKMEPSRLASMNDEDVIDALTALNGFGRWSAHMFLMFALGRCDVWPVDDLGIRAGLQVLLGADQRPSPAEATELGERWTPRRSAMALLLWHVHESARTADS